MKKIANISAVVLMFFVVLMTIVSAFSIWAGIDDKILSKSIQTIILLSGVTLILTAVDNYKNKDNNKKEEYIIQNAQWAELFRAIRMVTVSVLFAALIALAFIGVLAIWIELGPALEKVISTIAVVAFSAMVTSVVCYEREGKLTNNQNEGGVNNNQNTFN